MKTNACGKIKKDVPKPHPYRSTVDALLETRIAYKNTCSLNQNNSSAVTDDNDAIKTSTSTNLVPTVSIGRGTFPKHNASEPLVADKNLISKPASERVVATPFEKARNRSLWASHQKNQVNGVSSENSHFDTP